MPNILNLDEYNNTRHTKNLSVFCHAPFSSLNFAQNGDATACCYNRRHVFGTYPHTDIAAIWRGIQAEEMRRRMVDHDLPAGCELCLEQCQSGNYANLRAKYYDALAEETYYKRDDKYDVMPKVFEFEISNICNLECIMCNGYYSSAIRRNRELRTPLHDPYDNKFVQQMEFFIPHLQEMKFLGGEPFLVPMYYKIWDLIKRINPGVSVTITTNGTILTPRVKEVLDDLNAHIVISMDSINKACYERIRVNANYEQVISHLEYFQTYVRTKHTSLSMAVCPMKYNWREIPALVKFCNDREINLCFNTVIYPTDASLKTLSYSELREIVGYLVKASFEGSNAVRTSNLAAYLDFVRHLSYFKTIAAPIDQREGTASEEWKPMGDKVLDGGSNRNAAFGHIGALIERMRCRILSMARVLLGQYFASGYLLQKHGVTRTLLGDTPHCCECRFNIPEFRFRVVYPKQGHIESGCDLISNWVIELNEGCKAMFQTSDKPSAVMRIYNIKVNYKEHWHIQLQRGHICVERGVKYLLCFRARADKKRPIAASVGQNHAPWDALGYYREYFLTPQWEYYEGGFTASDNDVNARIRFDLGKSDISVEIADVELRRELRENSKIADALPTNEKSITYEFNSMGCRGDDYFSPKPHEIFRILCLGSSFTMGVGVPQRMTFSAWLERMLSKTIFEMAGKYTCEVINGGVGNYELGKREMYREDLIYKYTPDVVFTILDWNDALSWSCLEWPQLAGGKRLKSDEIIKLIRVILHSSRPNDYQGCIEHLISIYRACCACNAKMGIIVFKNSRLHYFDALCNAVRQGIKRFRVPIWDLGPALLNGRKDQELFVHPGDRHPNEMAHYIAGGEMCKYIREVYLGI